MQTTSDRRLFNEPIICMLFLHLDSVAWKSEGTKIDGIVHISLLAYLFQISFIYKYKTDK